VKILFVLENHYPNIGGVETLFKNLSESLANEGHEITILTNQYDNKLLRKEELNGVKIIRVPFRNRYFFTFFGLFPALKLARQADLIQTTSYNAGVPAFFAGLLTRTKVVITFHEVWNKLWFNLPYMGKLSAVLHYSFEWFLLKLPFTKFIAVSNATQQSLITAGIKQKNIQLIYNGVNYDRFIRLYNLPDTVDLKNNSNFNFIYFGRLGISKGLNLILDAAKILKDKGKTFLLTLIIPKEPKHFHRRILNTVNDFELAEFVNVKSELSITELHENLSEADAVLIPSYSEGFCFSAVEGIAMGLPIITSGKGSLAEVVTGPHLTMPTHDGAGLAEVMNRAMGNSWDYKEPKEFHLSDTVEAYTRLYQNYNRTS